MTYKKARLIQRTRKDYGINTQLRYTTKSGKVKSLQVPQTRKNIVATIRKGLGLSKRQYEKYYDITRNKLRHYERVTGAKKQSALQYLYYKARTKENYAKSGKEYSQSIKSKFIESFSSRSSGITSTNIKKEDRQLIYKYTRDIFGTKRGERGLVGQNKYAQQIVKNIKDPQKRLQALTEFANRRRTLVKMDADKRLLSKDRLPFSSDRSGSPENEYDEDAFNEIMELYGN